jgi:hypothetical protein
MQREAEHSALSYLNKKSNVLPAQVPDTIQTFNSKLWMAINLNQEKMKEWLNDPTCAEDYFSKYQGFVPDLIRVQGGKMLIPFESETKATEAKKEYIGNGEKYGKLESNETTTAILNDMFGYIAPTLIIKNVPVNISTSEIQKSLQTMLNTKICEVRTLSPCPNGKVHHLAILEYGSNPDKFVPRKINMLRIGKESYFFDIFHPF